MDKKIRKVKRTEGKYILNKNKKDENVKKILKQNQEKSEQKISEKKEEANNIKQEINNTGNKDTKPINNKVGCFQLVVVKKLPWYKKAFKAIVSLFKGFNKKEITLKCKK